MTTLERPHMSTSSIVYLCWVWDCRSNLIYIQQIQAYHDLWCLHLEGDDSTINIYAGHEDETVPGMKHQHNDAQCQFECLAPTSIKYSAGFSQGGERVLGCKYMLS